MLIIAFLLIGDKAYFEYFALESFIETMCGEKMIEKMRKYLWQDTGEWLDLQLFGESFQPA